ncbi:MULTISPECIES: Arc family DNA-binding protein [unclassified Mesorhizobium]|uniref:Arc family DNA-binding protein n=1 Tax=unclassified Mesorhizobium TaxID=325217 RepID=UPI000FCA992E|nr:MULTISPECIES: Arc family DNA-binding protein [unclassified Mesorhizobium]RUW26342.1 Arc family DNA-binding protein [Mesorhizobium sp. M4B.F.Ca.ET.013.02.1.1]RVD21169.1 Arc family DNA-binding protein [Mesorhizobium sp. M4B.F.Ca.ET.017.02.2.1]
MARADPQLNMRLPADAVAFIDAQATRNGSSRTSEIVRCIRDRMDRETKTATSELAGSN